MIAVFRGKVPVSGRENFRSVADANEWARKAQMSWTAMGSSRGPLSVVEGQELVSVVSAQGEVTYV